MASDLVKMPAEGTQLGNYVLQSRISRTLLGHFFLAKENGKQAERLIQILPKELTEIDKGIIARHKKQSELLNRLNVEGLLKIDRYDEANGFQYVVFEGESFSSLRQHVEANRSGGNMALPEEEARAHTRRLGTILEAVHQIKIGHFCITPDFLFLDKEKKLSLAGVGLFESIKYQAFEQYVSRAILPFAEKEKESYSILDVLSPEIRDNRDYDLRSDLYAAGMVSYYFLVGKRPDRHWQVPTKARSEINDGWDLFISHCLEPRLEDRCPSAKAFINDLDSLESLKSQPKREGDRMLRVLELIPLPRRLIEQYTSRTILRIRLALISIIGFLAVGSASLLLIILFEDIDDGSELAVVNRVASPDLANIILRVDPPNARITVKGSRRGSFLINDGIAYLRTGRGQFTISAQAPLHKTKSVSVEVMDGQLNRILRLPVPWSDVRITGVPDSRVDLLTTDDQSFYLGRISSEGELVLEDRILEGEYRFRLTDPGYEPFTSEPVTLSMDAPAAVDTSQIALPGKLQVRTNPEGATVEIDGEPVGESPIEVGNLPQEPVVVKISLPGYRTVEEVMRIPPGETISLDVGELERKEGFIDLELTLGGEAPSENLKEEIELRLGEETLPAYTGLEDLPVDEGMVTLSIRHPDYLPFEKELQIRDRTRETLKVNLPPRPARLRLTIDTDNPIQVSVDEEVVELEGEAVELEPGERQRVTVQILDFFGVSREFEPGPNDKIEWEVPLRPLPGPEKGEDWNPPYFNLPMTWITPGSFRMSSPIREQMRLPNEDNRTRVIIPEGFWIGIYEVTQKVYARVMNENPSGFDGEDHPVESVTWDKAVEFCSQLTRRERNAGRLPEGYEYRLPTEAEWEYAARASTTTPFAFGETATPEDGNYKGTYGLDSPPELEETPYGTVAVGQYPPNPWGLHDVHGNVAEWTLDRYWDRLPGGQIRDYYNDSRGRGYSVRGGSWKDSAHLARSAARDGLPQGSQRDSVGFRVVLAPVK